MEIQNTGKPSNKVAENTETKKTQKVSVTYTLRAMLTNVRKLHELGLITEEELKTVQHVHTNALMKYVDVV